MIKKKSVQEVLNSELSLEDIKEALHKYVVKHKLTNADITVIALFAISTLFILYMAMSMAPEAPNTPVVKPVSTKALNLPEPNLIYK